MTPHLSPLKSSRLLRLGASIIAISGAFPAFAQNNEQGVAASPDSDTEIVVEGQRLRGQLDVDQAPVLELTEEDIQASGATSIAELIAVAVPQSTSSSGRGGSGRPVFLVNGVRIGSFREMRSYPPESIAKVEVMPEEVAQRLGFPPDRRVINLILKDNYSSREVEAEYEQPSSGGYRALEGELTYVGINKGDRINLNAEINDVTMMRESERDVIQTAGSVSDVTGDPDQAQYRSLISDSFNFEISGNWAKSLADSGSSLSLNTTYERSEIRSLSGLNTVTLTAPDSSTAFRTLDAADPLETRIITDTISSSGSWARPVGSWRLNTTFDASVSDNVREIDRRGDTAQLVADAAAGLLAIDGALPSLGDAGFDTATSEIVSAQAKSTLRGTLIDLPAGELSTTLDVGYSWDRITSFDTRSDSGARLKRGDLEAGINVAVPLTSSRELFLDTFGSFTLNGQAGLNHYSDFGTLYDWSLGLNWKPWDNLDLQATYTRNEAAPSLSNLGSPQVTSLNVPVFDFVNGQTVLATVTSGGNPNLLAETQKDWKFSANWEVPFRQNTRLSAEYFNISSNDVTSSFPALTQAIEEAFPSRFTRDITGILTAIDRTPVTFEATQSKRLVLGFNTRGAWGKARPQADEQSQRGRGDANRAPSARRGAPTPEQREQFMAFRARICAEDGMEVLTRLVDAVEGGQDLSAVIPNFDPERFNRILDRARGDDGKVDPEKLARFRTFMCSMDPAAMRGARAGSGQQARGGGGRRGFGRPGRGGDGRGRYFINVSHTIELENEVLIAPGGPLLDQLAGDALTNFGFARHSTRAFVGMFRNGVGMRISGTYTGKAKINGNSITGTSPLFFGDLATFNLRLFADLGQVMKKDDGFFKNFRVSLRADNMFDARRRVVDDNGETPTSFQPVLLDPTGRYVGIQLRKLF